MKCLLLLSIALSLSACVYDGNGLIPSSQRVTGCYDFYETGHKIKTVCDK